jgi:hypothetical protein
MDITIKTGRNYFQVDPLLGSILCELGLAEKYIAPPPSPPQPPIPRYGLVQMPSGCWVIQRVCGPETGYFDNYPHLLKTCWPDCPDGLVIEYARRFIVRADVHILSSEYATKHAAFMAGLEKGN